jgi:hypothetical protein
MLDIENSITYLIDALFSHHKKSIVLLVDDFDAMLMRLALNNSELFKCCLDLTNSLFSGIKNNTMVELAVFAGENPLINSSMFSNLSHSTHDSVLSPYFNDFFGFTETEVDLLIENLLKQRTDLNFYSTKKDVMNWYKGYQIGGVSLFNPWSVMHCLENLRIKLPEPFWNYWRDEDSFELFNKIIPLLKTSGRIRELLRTSSVQFNVEEKIDFQNVCSEEDSLITLMIHVGLVMKIDSCGFIVPNQEMKRNFERNFKVYQE